MTELLRLLLAVAAAYLMGKLVSKLKLPAILGWLLTGMVLGPHALGLVDQALLDAEWYNVAESVMECTAGLMIGTELVWKRMRRSGAQIVVMTLAESLGTFVCVAAVFAAIFAFTGTPLYLALVFGGIALATAPAPSLSIVARGYHGVDKIAEGVGMDEFKNEMIEGRNAVLEALRAGRALDKVYIARGETDKALAHIAGLARERGVSVSDCDRRKLDAMSVTKAHQGVIAVCAVREYASLDDILALAESRGEAPFVVVCDEISDPHNLGAIIRSAECVGAHGVVIPKRRSAGLTAVVGKTSAGAAEHLPVARVANISAALQELKDRGLWVYGAAAEGSSPMWETDLTGPLALVIGSEGEGLGRLVRERCDFLVSIPLRGKVGSLNASTAAAVLMYEVLRQKLAK